MYEHVEGLARRLNKGVDGIEGVEGGAGDFSAEILQQMWASSKDDGILVITAEELAALNRVLFGFLKSYRSMGAQMKAFFDSTDQL
ncbi:hypothetical protein Ahy_A08g041316 [Arachis hypogaea]|uniref:Uncharacterized protein n=1 Tax=Arachis hypogaea TaxID=3818 RepID=A0A445C2D9_ARAHY|nr:hypothetical protein Ahy_A08g041316 [Arachis hypogaea]